ncbi:MAG TPA: beta-phosphoglucomutase, partial [Candidatus Binatia bacterium]|nr:beta-phosphoglucomutase [Candidatus Binatia bacterium]
MPLRAVIFDLDGVITDTAEYHFRAWKRMADEEGIPFSREDNEKLRGVSRRESLLRILQGRVVSEEKMSELMARKNRAYQVLLEQVTPDDLLPGVETLLAELDEAGIPYAIASASRNARDVVDRLGVGQRLAVLADGSSVSRTKPAPDLFRFAAAQLDRLPRTCLVVEDAAAGVEAALRAGMPALALGPIERFSELGAEQGRFAHRGDLQGVTLDELKSMVGPDPLWHVVEDHFEPARQHHMETVLTTGNGVFATRGSFEEGYEKDRALTLAHGVFDDAPVVVTELVNLPNWLDLRLQFDGKLFRLDQGKILDFHRELDLQRALLQRQVRWQAADGLVVDLTFERFISYASPQIAALRLLVTPVNRAVSVQVEAGIDGYVANEDLLHWEHLAQGSVRCEPGGEVWLHSRTRHSDIALCTAAMLQGVGEAAFEVADCPHYPALRLSQRVPRAQTLQVDKIVSYATSRDSVPEPRNVVERALQQLEGRQYDHLKRAHVDAWRGVWSDIDVLIEGDDEAQLAVRFNLFQLQIAAPRDDDRASIGAKTLSGLGYRGHVFWDTEIFILPFFSYTQPEIARNLLCYRYHTLEGARHKARVNGYRGAQFAWESALTGEEVTPTWVPNFAGTGLVRIWTGDIEIHITADVAYAIMQYWRVSCDHEFMR